MPALATTRLVECTASMAQVVRQAVNYDRAAAAYREAVDVELLEDVVHLDANARDDGGRSVVLHILLRGRAIPGELVAAGQLEVEAALGHRGHAAALHAAGVRGDLDPVTDAGDRLAAG